MEAPQEFCGRCFDTALLGKMKTGERVAQALAARKASGQAAHGPLHTSRLQTYAATVQRSFLAFRCDAKGNVQKMWRQRSAGAVCTVVIEATGKAHCERRWVAEGREGDVDGASAASAWLKKMGWQASDVAQVGPDDLWPLGIVGMTLPEDKEGGKDPHDPWSMNSTPADKGAESDGS